jgi:ribose 5-phosphate isomerase A
VVIFFCIRFSIHRKSNPEADIFTPEDYRKDQSRLLTNWPTIPIEVAPIASQVVLRALKALGSTTPQVRPGTLSKAGPLKTDQDFFIIDAPFPSKLLTSKEAAGVEGEGDGTNGQWEVVKLSKAIKSITGVLEVGLFCGYNGVEAAEAGLHKGGQKPIAVYFGMSDGSVKMRKKES